MRAKLYEFPLSKLQDLKVTDGQLIVLEDVPGMYYDMGGTRHKLQASDEVLYEVMNLSDVDKDTSISRLNLDTVTTGSLNNVTDITNVPFSNLEFVFYDRGMNNQFSGTMHGIRYGNGMQYTYKNCNNITISSDTDTTAVLNNGNIYRETSYIGISLGENGTFSINSKRAISESIINGIVTMEETDVSSSNRIGILKVIGRR